MSLEAALKQLYNEDLADVSDVEELDLDELVTIPKLGAADKQFVERFRTLTSLSMNGLGLVSVENFPAIPTLMILSGPLDGLTVCPFLNCIHLESNPISDFKQLSGLKPLRHLMRLELAGTPLAMEERFRERVLAEFPSLEVLNGTTRAGEEASDVAEDEDDDESEDEGEDSDEGEELKDGKRPLPEDQDDDGTIGQDEVEGKLLHDNGIESDGKGK